MKLTKRSSKKRILQEWIAALLGVGEYKGKYKQGKGSLHVKGTGRTKDTFCCLGVLSNLAEEAGVCTCSFNDAENRFEYEGQGGYLPESVRTWAGLKTRKGFINEEYKYDLTSLASLNDNGKSFKEIAKVIESKPKGLFVK